MTNPESPHSSSVDEASPRPLSAANKRKRLSHACNYCRTSKKRCDEQWPSCRNCLATNRVCITTDPRKAGSPQVIRKRAVSEARSRHPTRKKDGGSTISVESPLQRNVNEATTGSAPGVDVSCNDGHDNPRRDSHTTTSIPSTYETEGDPNFRSNDRNPQRQGLRVMNEASTIFGQSGQRDLHPLHDPQQTALNNDGTDFRKKFLGPSSLQVFAQWVDMAMNANNQHGGLSSDFRFGMRGAEEFDLSRTAPLPALKDIPNVQHYIEVYLRNINPMFPFVNGDLLAAILAKFVDVNPATELKTDDAPELACLYAVLAAAMNEEGYETQAMSDSLIQAAFSLYVYAVVHPYKTSVQAMGVMAIALKGRLKDGVASQVIGQAIRIAYSIGLHEEDSVENRDLTHRKVWLACYAFEKFLAFESGRPTVISNDPPLLMPITDLPKHDPDYLRNAVELGKILNQITERLFSKKALRLSAGDMMLTLGELDAKLVAWTDSVPTIIRPGRDLIYCPPQMRPFATALALQYYATLGMIHRTALLIDHSIHAKQVMASSLEQNVKHRVLAGQSICVQAARSILHAVSDLLKLHPTSQLLNPSPCVLALYILLIYIMRDPGSWTASSDLELMKRASQFLEKIYTRYGQDQRFIRMFSKLYRLAARIVRNVNAAEQDNLTRTGPPACLSPQGVTQSPGLSDTPQENNNLNQRSISRLANSFERIETNVHGFGANDASAGVRIDTQARDLQTGHYLNYSPTQGQRRVIASPHTMDKAWLSSMSNDLSLGTMLNSSPRMLSFTNGPHSAELLNPNLDVQQIAAGSNETQELSNAPPPPPPPPFNEMQQEGPAAIHPSSSSSPLQSYSWRNPINGTMASQTDHGGITMDEARFIFGLPDLRNSNFSDFSSQYSETPNNFYGI